MRRLLRGLAILTGVVLLPAAAFAQAGLAGVVKDASGAVLPGVTVEAASPALIEKTRAVVTDGTGQYKIENLRPGAYTVTFTLTGFNTVKREGIELTGSFVASVNADMKVGAVEETITVTGETPLVDIQSSSRQSVLTKDVIDALPTGRSYAALAVLLPGVNSSAGDVGGALGSNANATMTTHGGAGGDQRILQNGLNVMTLQSDGGSVGAMIPNQSAAEEVAVDTSGASAERQTGGVAINYIQRDGGNTFKSYSFFTYGGEGLASSNLTDRLRTGNYGATASAITPGLSTPNALKQTWEINPGIGGPIVKDQLWFYYALRYQRAEDYAANMFVNKNAFDLTKWAYSADTSQQALSRQGWWNDSQLRVTWQATPGNKFAGTWDQQQNCQCPGNVSATTAIEASRDRRVPVQQLMHGEWFSTVTSRLLVEFVGLHRTERWGDMELRPSESSPLTGAFGGSLNAANVTAYNHAIGVTEQNAVNGLAANSAYRGPGGIFNTNWVPSYHFRGSVSYVTGAHSLKVGFNEAIGYIENKNYMTTVDATGKALPIRYRFKSTPDANGNVTVPTANQVTAYATPYTYTNNQDHDFGLFAQDKWTMNRLTLNYGLRFDWFKSSYPDQVVTAADLFKGTSLARAVDNTVAGADNIDWKDITPRFGLAYDLRGDGKTAIKVSINKYVAGATASGNATTNPVSRLVNSASRTWTDSDADFVVDCDLTNAAKNGECAALTGASAGFGTLTPSALPNDNFRAGWNKRGYNWEFSAGVQQEVLPRVSVDVAYFRRLFGNFTVTDNLALDSTMFDTFSIVAPVDSRLGEASGTTITGLYDVKPAFSTVVANNATILVDGTNLNGAKQIQHWNGVDVNVNARLGPGVTLRGGFSTGRTSNNNCAVMALVPEALGNVPEEYCATDTPFLTQVKAIATYMVPKVDVQIAGTFQSNPGAARQAVFTLDATNAQSVSSTLGRTPTGGQKTINLLNAGLPIYGERLNQIDLRFAKILRYGRTRTNVSVDVFNLLNKDTVATESTAIASLYRPLTLVQARFVKFSAQFDF